MKKIYDFKTSTQLIIAFGIVFILIVVLSIISWQQTNKLALRTEKLYEHPLVVRRALSSFKSSTLIMRIEFRNVLLAKDQKTWDNADQNYHFEKNNVEKQFTILYSKYLGNINDIDSLKIYFNQWNIIREDIIKRTTSHKIDEELLDELNSVELRNSSNILFHKIDFLENFAQNKAEQFYKESITLKEQLNSNFLIFVLTVLVLVIFIVYYLSKLINSPLKEIKRATTHFMNGNYSIRSSYSSQNEFGSLSKSFNEMAEIVETEFILNDHSASLAGVMLKEDDAHKFCALLLKNLLSHTNAQMGSIYFLNDEKTYYENFECIGLDEDECKPVSVNQPKGIIALTLADKKINYLKNIPESSQSNFNILSGNLKPQEIITIPIFSGNEAVAFISIYTIYKFSTISVRLIETLFTTITSRIIGILDYKYSVELSNKLKEQNIELDTQTKELQSKTFELKEQNIELEQQKQQLGEVSRLKTNFLSNMSHELRTPLNSVIALSGVLNRRLNDKIPDEEHGYLEVIERNGKHLLSLINDILDISRIESGRVEIDKNSFAISTLISELVSMIKPQADEKQIGLNYLKPTNSILIESDYNKCLHILQNIIGNAVKFTENGSVDITAKEKDGNLHLTVSDTGIGISEENIPNIFDEFRQADGSNSRKFGGTGLGLAIAKKYTKLLGGKIMVTSEIGKGSVFTLILPLKVPYSEKEVISIAPKIKPSINYSKKEMPKGKSILLVEDTNAMAIQMKELLEEENYKVTISTNGAHALNYLQNNLPDAIILDLMMPEMDGFEVLNNIRSNTQTAHLPILILTAKILTKDELKFLKSKNAHQLIQKGNIKKDSLVEAIMLLMFSETEKTTEINTLVSPIKVVGKPKVLVIEDNLDNLIALKALIGSDYIIIEAFDGFEGLEKAKEYIPDLILMDIAMPKMNGFETLIEIRKDTTISHIPVISVTSSALKGDKNYFLDFGFNGYVSKPVNLDFLTKEINDWLIINE